MGWNEEVSSQPGARATDELFGDGLPSFTLRTLTSPANRVSSSNLCESAKSVDRISLHFAVNSVSAVRTLCGSMFTPGAANTRTRFT